MPLEKLKEVPLELWLGTLGYSRNGVCFYMSEYVEKTTWAAGSYADAKNAASAAVPSTIMKSGKAKNLGDRKRTKWLHEAGQYRMQAALVANSIYRIGLWFGAAGQAPPEDADPLVGRVHAATVATGAAGTLLFFEPNFGLYEATDAAATHKALLEQSIDGLYGAGGSCARNFVYLKGRALKTT